MLGKYELRGRVGQGAMGTVYDGWDPAIARRVAIKTVTLPAHPDPETAELIARFRREAQAAGRLNHPSIVAVHDYGETDALAYIVMEYVDGPSLKSLLDRQERFALPEIRRIMDDLLAGLQFCHELGVIHRDVKPANVMLTADRRAKLADFGIARIEDNSITQAGEVLGTPAYMAPEQFIGQVVDSRADIYAAGVLLYQLLTGERPFEGSASSIMHKVLNVTPPAPSRLSVVTPLPLDPVVLRAMAKRPEDRFPSAASFAAAIRAALDAPAELGTGGEATRVLSVPGVAAPRPPAPKITARRRSRAAIGAGVLGLALLASEGAWWVWWRPAGPDQTVVATLPAAPPAGPAPAAPTAAPKGVAALRRTIAATIAGTSCVLVTTNVASDNSVTVRGLAAEDADKLLLARLHHIIAWPPLTWQVRMISRHFCTAVAVVRPVTPLAGAPEFGLALLPAGAAVPLRVTLPRFAAYARVDVLHDDGSIVHLYPAAAAQPQPLEPGSTLRPDDAGASLPHPQAGGRSLIIAVAASKPLVLQHTPATIEVTSARYLMDLDTAISAARSAGVEVTATVLPFDTVPPAD
jgi:eukaryotic-like serine/threonine-protein kinase